VHDSNPNYVCKKVLFEGFQISFTIAFYKTFPMQISLKGRPLSAGCSFPRSDRKQQTNYSSIRFRGTSKFCKAFFCFSNLKKSEQTLPIEQTSNRRKSVYK